MFIYRPQHCDLGPNVTPHTPTGEIKPQWEKNGERQWEKENGGKKERNTEKAIRQQFFWYKLWRCYVAAATSAPPSVMSVYICSSLKFINQGKTLTWHPPTWVSLPIEISLSLSLSQIGALKWCSILRVKSAACWISAEVTDASYPTQHHRGTGDSQHTNEPPYDTHTHIHMHMWTHKDHKRTQAYTHPYMHMLRCILFGPSGV